MGIFCRLIGRCRTKPPADRGSWKYTEPTIEIDLSKAPELSPPGAAVRLEGDGLPERVLVVHGVDDQWYAFRNRCTHAGRRIDPLPGKAKLECCSMGRTTWGYDGARVSGSGQGPLACYSVQREGDSVIVKLDAAAKA